MDRKKIKQAIEDYEYCANGFAKLSGCDAQIVNLKITKDKYVCDVKLIDDLDGKIERYNNCEYPKNLIDERIK